MPKDKESTAGIKGGWANHTNSAGIMEMAKKFRHIKDKNKKELIKLIKEFLNKEDLYDQEYYEGKENKTDPIPHIVEKMKGRKEEMEYKN